VSEPGGSHSAPPRSVRGISESVEGKVASCRRRRSRNRTSVEGGKNEREALEETARVQS